MKVAIIETDKGNIELELFPNEAPGTVANFEKLANEGFVSKAPQKLIDEEKTKLQDYMEMLEKVKERLSVVSEKIK